MPNQQTVQQVINGLQQMSTAMGLYSSRVSARVGVSPTDLETIELLSRHGPASTGQIAAQHGLAEGDVAAGVDRLTKAGFASTQGGNVALNQNKLNSDVLPHYQAAVQATQQLCQQYSDDQLSAIADFLSKAVAQSNQLLQQV